MTLSWRGCPVRARIQVARVRSCAWRFGTLRYAERVFAGIPEGMVLDRKLFGHRIWLEVGRSSVQQLLALDGERFIAERALVVSLLSPGMTFVDVGANIGYYMLLAQRSVGKRGMIICIEPDEANLRELSRQIKGNDLTNVVVLPVAAGAEDKEARLEPGINARVRADGSGTGEVRLRRLDSLLDAPVDVLKIDVEGYEGHVLDGAAELLRRWRPALFLEVHPQLLDGPYSVESVLEVVLGLGGTIEVYTGARPTSTLAKVKARYVRGRAVQRSDLASLIRACQSGQQRDPFWVVRRTS